MIWEVNTEDVPKSWNIMYAVTADFLPFRKWMIKAGSESEARLELAHMLNIPYEQTSASIAMTDNL